jgi:thioredoxin-related protein
MDAMITCRFVDKLKEDIPGAQVKEQLQLLFFVYALSLIKENTGEFLSVGYMTTKQVELAKEQLRILFKQVGTPI